MSNPTNAVARAHLLAEVEAEMNRTEDGGEPWGFEGPTFADYANDVRHRLAYILEGGNERVRLEYLRGELQAEQISQGELIELQGLAAHIEEWDVELLEAAGVPEFPDLTDDAPVPAVDVLAGTGLEHLGLSATEIETMVRLAVTTVDEGSLDEALMSFSAREDVLEVAYRAARTIYGSHKDVGAHIAAVCASAGLGVMEGVYGVLRDRETVPESVLLALDVADVANDYDLYLGPAVDNIQREMLNTFGGE